MLCAGLHLVVAYCTVVIYAVHYRRLHQSLRFGLAPTYSRLDGPARAGKPAERVFVQRMYALSMTFAVGLPTAAVLAWPAKLLFDAAAYALSDCSALQSDDELTSAIGFKAVTRFTFTNVGTGRCGRHVELWGRETVDDLWFTIEAPLTGPQPVETVRVTERSSLPLLGEVVLHSREGVVGVCGALLKADVARGEVSADHLRAVLETGRARLVSRCPLGASPR